jgi:hypothetical protein
MCSALQGEGGRREDDKHSGCAVRFDSSVNFADLLHHRVVAGIFARSCSFADDHAVMHLL